MPRVTLREVARRSGFAVSTVSNALRDLGNLPPETRRKIREVAATLGYTPNPLLASLAGRHFRASPQDVPVACFYRPFADPVNRKIVDVILQAQISHAQSMGYRLQPFRLDDFQDGKQATRVLFFQGFQGIILPEDFSLECLPGMEWNRFAVAAWGAGFYSPSQGPPPFLHRATVDHFDLVIRAWEEVWRRGYRRIGFVLVRGRPGQIDDRTRFGAIQTCLRSVPLRSRIPTLTPRSAPGSPANIQEIGNWVRRHHPQAVIGFNGYVHWALRAQGFRMPRDVGFAALHHDTHLESVMNARTDLAGMKEMRIQTMFAALELLDQQIRHHQYGLSPQRRTLMIHSEWVDGSTLPDKPGNDRRTLSSS